jgi:hypothetical protein
MSRIEIKKPAQKPEPKPMEKPKEEAKGKVKKEELNPKEMKKAHGGKGIRATVAGVEPGGKVPPYTGGPTSDELDARDLRRVSGGKGIRASLASRPLKQPDVPQLEGDGPSGASDDFRKSRK